MDLLEKRIEYSSACTECREEVLKYSAELCSPLLADDVRLPSRERFDQAGQGRAGQCRAGQGRAGQGRAGQGRAGQ